MGVTVVKKVLELPKHPLMDVGGYQGHHAVGKVGAAKLGVAGFGAPLGAVSAGAAAAPPAAPGDKVSRAACGMGLASTPPCQSSSSSASLSLSCFARLTHIETPLRINIDASTTEPTDKRTAYVRSAREMMLGNRSR